MTVKRIVVFGSLAKRLAAHTDRSGDCWLWTGARGSTGYGVMRVKGKLTGPHRIAYEDAHGPIPSGFVIDHKCHTRLCVNPDHLQAVTPDQNAQNVPARGRSGIRGVTFHEPSGMWRARVRKAGGDIHLGLFADIKDAERAVVAKRNEVFTNNLADRTDP